MNRRCEGCAKRATREDCEGVPLCADCYVSLLVSEHRDVAKKLEAAEAKVAALEARLAEVGPVVEAARDLNKALSQWERGLGIYICDVAPKRDALERALNAPRAMLEKGGTA